MEGNVAISHQALEQIFTDSVEAGDIEVGGLLTGYSAEGWVVITRAIPTSKGTITRIPMTSQDMARAAERLYPGEKIMGWYHSHPGHTVFFSQDDIESHERFLQFNPRFQALVIDPHQAKRGDPISDCVKFYAVKDHRAVLINDYRITGSSSKAYNPQYFTFDKYGFPYHNPVAGYGITAADDRELRQMLKVALENRESLIGGLNKLKSENEELVERMSGKFVLSRKLFAATLLLLILIPFFSGLVIGHGIQRASEKGTQAEIESIAIEHVFKSQDSQKIYLVVDLSNIGEEKIKAIQSEYLNENIKVFLVGDTASNEEEIGKKEVMRTGNRLLIEVSLEKSIQDLLNEGYHHVRIELVIGNQEPIGSDNFLIPE
jgi:26S proteasome regulatory subunit N11